jgi:hypothetical protein
MKHEELVVRAEGWLRGARRRTVVLTRFAATGVYEVPDVMGWRGKESIRVECRTTRRAVMLEARRLARRDGREAVGGQRYFLVPPRTVEAADIPEGWGLLECHPKIIRIVRDVEAPDELGDLRAAWRLRNELAMLTTALSRAKRHACRCR